MAIDLEIPGTTAQGVCPLSSMQQSMLWNSQLTPQPGLDIEQIIGELREGLDLRAFERGWQQVVQRHKILRTGFRWREMATPRQEIYEHVPLQFESKDWRKLSTGRQKKHYAAWLQEDRQRGFDLGAPPLMRVTVFELAESSYRFVWTFHHVLLDATAFSIVLEELSAFYEALRAGYELELSPPRAYGEYVEWLAEQDPAESFWGELLRGFEEPTPLVVAHAAARALAKGEETHGEQSIRFTEAETAALMSLAQTRRITLSTIVEAGWGLLLGRYSSQEDVVFGAVRACRKSAFAGADSIVGLLINTLPMRVRIDPSLAVGEWLGQVRQQQLGLRAHEHTPLLKILECSQMAQGTPLFETIINFQNTAWHEALREQGEEWRNRCFSIRNQPNYALWVDSYSGRELVLKIGYDRSRFDDETIRRMLDHFKTLLGSMASAARRWRCAKSRSWAFPCPSIAPKSARRIGRKPKCFSSASN